MKIQRRLFVGLLLALMCASPMTAQEKVCGYCCQQNANDGSENFVNITDVVPDVILEIRYFGTYNFVGNRIDGYMQPTALLTRQAAEALKAVSDDVKAQGYRLKLFDAYRPQRAVDNFVPILTWRRTCSSLRTISPRRAAIQGVRQWTLRSLI